MGISTLKFYFRSVFFIAFACCSGFGADAQLRDSKSFPVKINVSQQPLQQVLKLLESQTRFNFSFDKTEVNVEKKISLTFSGSLADALKTIGDQTGLDFNQTGASTIAIRKHPVGAKQTRLVSGTVYSRVDGTTLPGVIGTVKGTGMGFITDANGNFTYKISSDDIGNTVLQFRYIGYVSKDMKLGNLDKFTVYLDNDRVSMNEVVVTGSYTKEKRREDVVGSISQINAEQLQTDRPIESLDKMLEGMVAGVYVQTNTELGTPVSVNIRGLGSLPTFGSNNRSTSSQPLYVVDRIPVYEQQKSNDPQQFQGETYLNPLANINPDDVKSISVLKDATASALYGANAANGVIIITTKSGTPGKTKINLSYDAGVATFMNQYQFLNGPDYYRLLRETYLNDGRTEADASQLAGSPTTNTDWFALTNRNATYQNANFSISGGKAGTSFLFSSGYLNQQSSAIGNDLQKTYFKLRLDHEVNDRFKVGFSMSPTLSQKNGISNYGAVLLPPNVSPYNADGTFADILAVPNPIAVVQQNQDYSKGYEVLSSANASYKLSDAISFSGTAGMDNYQNKETTYLSAQNASGRSRNGFLQIYDRNYLSWVTFVQGTYDKTFAKRHTINFLAGTQAQNKNTDLLRGTGTGFSYDQLRQLNLAASQTSASSKQSEATISYYSQLGYDLDKKYYANFNARIDRSSLFGGDKQTAFNGSVGLAWILSKEGFLKDNKLIDFLKFRVTYGTTGNSRIGNYASRGLYDFSTSGTYNGNTASVPSGSAAPNPFLGWERNYKLNLGIDITFLHRFQLTAEYYNNTIKDLISSIYVPLETGFTTYQANTGTARNQGFELTLNSENIRSNDFTWNTAFNFGLNRNGIIAFNQGFSSLYSTSSEAAALRVGISSSAIWGYRWAGVDSQTGAEMFYDNKGNKLNAQAIRALPITEATVIGDRLPDFQGGFINNFGYKGLTLTVNLLYSYGADVLMSYIQEGDGNNLANRNQSVNLLDRWKKPGDVTTIPRLTSVANYVANSSRYVHNASYIKLSNVSLNYQLPARLTSKLNLQRITIFVNGTNLYYWYKERGTVDRNGVAEARFVYPETRSFTGGIKLGL